MQERHFLIKYAVKYIKVLAVGLVFATFAGSMYFFADSLDHRSVPEKTTVGSKKTVKKTNDITAPIVPVITQPEVIKETKIAPIKPSKKVAIKTNPIAGKTISNKDGTKTVLVSEGNVSNSEIQKCQASGTKPTKPDDVKFIDATGKNSALEKIVKDYHKDQLRWSQTEISSLYGIEVVDAGDTGWAGQFIGSYNLDAQGNVRDVVGCIELNVYYYKTSPYFNDYMKLVFSHEYGHLYTLYYKWTKWKLLAGTRFPDSYYSARPLTKTTTATDYSLGWENCDAEIIAEDYSYIYSGYGYHGMKDKYGLPAMPTISNWLTSTLTGASMPADQAPSISITSPVNGSEVSGNIKLTASATDDIKITKIAFLIADTLVGEDTISPYEISINTARYDNGTYTIKAVAYDSIGQMKTDSISLVFSNSATDSQPPVITVISPVGDPYSWSSGDLTLDFSATDNMEVVKMEIYINDNLVAEENSDRISRIWPYINGPAGSYNLKIKAYDLAGNQVEKTIIVNKS